MRPVGWHFNNPSSVKVALAFQGSAGNTAKGENDKASVAVR
jgi:hypothetical protein